MQEIADNQGNMYQVLDLYNNEWAIVYYYPLQDRDVMDVIHLQTKRTVKVLIYPEKTFMIYDIKLRCPGTYEKWNRLNAGATRSVALSGLLGNDRLRFKGV